MEPPMPTRPGPLPPPRLPGAPGQLLDPPTRNSRPDPPAPTGGGRRVVLAIGGVLVALAIVEGALALVGLAVRTTATGAQPIARPTTFLVVSNGSGDVHVHGRAEGAPGVTWTSHYSFRKPKVTVRQDGNQLVISSDCDGFSLLPGYCAVSVDVTVPSDLDVTVNSSAGDVSADGLDGALQLSSSAGDVRVDDVGGRSLVLHSSAGDVVARSVRATTVDARSDAGDVKLTFATPPDRVRAESSAGDVVVALPPGERSYAVDAGTSAGDTHQDVRSSTESPYPVRAHSSAGDVTVRYGA